MLIDGIHPRPADQPRIAVHYHALPRLGLVFSRAQGSNDLLDNLFPGDSGKVSPKDTAYELLNSLRYDIFAYCGRVLLKRGGGGEGVRGGGGGRAGPELGKGLR